MWNVFSKGPASLFAIFSLFTFTMLAGHALGATPFTRAEIGGQSLTYEPDRDVIVVTLDSSAESLRHAIRHVPYPLVSIRFEIPVEDCGDSWLACTSRNYVPCVVQTIALRGGGSVLAEYVIDRKEGGSYEFIVRLTSERGRTYEQTWIVDERNVIFHDQA